MRGPRGGQDVRTSPPKIASLRAGGGGGGALIFSYIRRLRPFFFIFLFFFFFGGGGGFKILNFNIWGGGFRKLNILGFKDFVDVFGGSSQNWTIFRGLLCI